MPAGPSISETLWAELMDQTSKLRSIIAGKGTPIEISVQQGHCIGLAKAIAIMINPYDPDLDAVRMELMERLDR
jgi:hypothetical protein